MPLVSVTTFKQYLPEVAGNDGDLELSNLLSRVESAIASYIGFPRFLTSGNVEPVLEDKTYTLYIDHTMPDLPFVLPLPIRPIVSITSWHSDVERLYGSDKLVPSSAYEIDKENGRLIVKSTESESIEQGFRANKVVLVAGFENAPADLEHAICVFGAHLQRAKSSQGKKSTTQRNVTIALSDRTMPKEVKEILYPYRVFRRVL
tara:strand:+ start:9233 stop:9844 length:612 start_codon:yes stop_codon:yes gene_type:complete